MRVRREEARWDLGASLPLEFFPGVQPLLLDGAVAGDVVRVLAHAASIAASGVGPTFTSWLANPSSGTAQLDPAESAFAASAAEVLARLGGAYARIVKSGAVAAEDAPMSSDAPQASGLSKGRTITFTLEALQAKHGDCLLLHWGDDRLAVIDGGPSGVFRATLRPRLEALRAEREVETLPIRLLMVSHIDDDHMHGVLDLTRHLADLREENKPLPWKIQTLWHNAFDDIVGDLEPLSTALGAAVAPVANDGPVPVGLGLDRYSALVMASVSQGRQLRDDAHALQILVNHPWKGLVCAPADKPRELRLEDGLTLTIAGPLQAQVEALRADWDKKLEEMKEKKGAEAQAIAADFVDKSVYNLSSIVVVASLGGRRMLLTGDARGDFILAGLRALGLLKNDTIHVDLLKVPHHGSDRNVNAEFFRQVTADHYVISADGRHGNPDPEMLRKLTRARGAAAYTIHLTNRVAAAEEFFKADRPQGRRYQVVYRADDAPSVVVPLGG